MAVWNAHPLAQAPETNITLAVGERCVAAIDLPGVAAGTTGTVMLANGLAWLRYRVRFSNGVELTYLDARHIAASPRGRH